MRDDGSLGSWMRRRFGVDAVAIEVARTQRELADVRGALVDPARLQEMLSEAIDSSELHARLASALQPTIEASVRAALSERCPDPAPQRRPRRAVAALGGAFAAALVLAAAIVPARNGGQVSTTNDPVSVALEETAGGFGMGRAPQADADIAQSVRARLAAEPALVGAAVSFSVADGWVWLRGRAGVAARDAAGRALAGLGDGTMVVNQIEVEDP